LASSAIRRRRSEIDSTSAEASSPTSASAASVLGDRYGEALEKGDLKLAFDPEEGALSVWHFEHRIAGLTLDVGLVGHPAQAL
jgi:maltooligosyltrehalose synthase